MKKILLLTILLLLLTGCSMLFNAEKYNPNPTPKPIVEEVEVTGGTEQQNFFLSRVNELFTGGDNPTFTSPFGMHDPALLNLEAYDFLWKRDRYSQPEVTP